MRPGFRAYRISKVTILLASMVTSLCVQSSPVFLLGDHLDEIKKDVIERCSSLPEKERILHCLISSGEAVKELEDYVKTKQGVRNHALCLSQVKQQESSWFYYLQCLSELKKTEEAHPFPELSGIALRRDSFRSQWLVLCRKTNGNNVSKCIGEKDKEFSEFLAHYKSLSSGSENDLIRFKRCMANGDLQHADFKSVSMCYTNREK